MREPRSDLAVAVRAHLAEPTQEEGWRGHHVRTSCGEPRACCDVDLVTEPFDGVIDELRVARFAGTADFHSSMLSRATATSLF